MSRPWEIIQGDVTKIAKTLEANSFDAILSDPPYGLKFMGKRWDYHVPSANTWAALLRVVKPGAAALIFGGSRTFHRLGCAVEDGGFIPRDCLTWLYAKGMPKNKNVLKPAWEPIFFARKMMEGTLKENVAKWGIGELAIDASRTEEGRHPANLAFDEEAAEILDAEVGIRPSRPSITRNGGGNREGSLFKGMKELPRPDSGYSDTGGPSRFFFCAKVSKAERHMGGVDNDHETLKPIALAKWLAGLVKPPKRKMPSRILVPFCGSGSEMIGALQAGWDEVVGIDIDPKYIDIAKARITHGRILST